MTCRCHKKLPRFLSKKLVSRGIFINETLIYALICERG